MAEADGTDAISVTIEGALTSCHAKRRVTQIDEPFGVYIQTNVSSVRDTSLEPRSYCDRKR